MKEQIKIRRSWLLDPSTKVQESKKDKQRFQEDDNDWQNLTGYIDKEDLEDFEDKEDDKD